MTANEGGGKNIVEALKKQTDSELDLSKDLVYTSNEHVKTVAGKYSMSISVPAINIESAVANEININIIWAGLMSARKYYFIYIGVSPSGKASDSDSDIP